MYTLDCEFLNKQGTVMRYQFLSNDFRSGFYFIFISPPPPNTSLEMRRFKILYNYDNNERVYYTYYAVTCSLIQSLPLSRSFSLTMRVFD